MLNFYSQKKNTAGQKQDPFEELKNEILEKHLHPQDSYEIAALLESMGWNDSRAYREFGIQTIFELANEIWDSIQSHISYNTFSSVEKPTFWFLLVDMVRNFLRGLIFAFPMAVSVAAMLNLKFSLWSYQYLSLEQATSIAIGTILSFIVVGGFTQAIARRGFFYIIQGYYNLALKSTFLFIIIGFIVCLLFSILIVVFNIVFNVFSYKMIFLIVIFFFFLTAIWLSVTVMYILKKEIVFTGLIIFGILLVYILFELLKINIIASQLISLCIISICSIILVLFFFRTAEKKSEKGIALRLPRFSITLYSVWPYFYYGFLYFSFLFVDRINAWTTNEQFMPYILWFRGEYELGLDFALLTLIIPMGVSEVIVSRLMAEIESSQKFYLAIESDKMYTRFTKGYKKMFLLILIGSAISSFLIYRLVYWYNQFALKTNGEGILDSHITQFVLLWGIISYVILSFCLMNAVILFALSQPNFIIRSIALSLIANILAGFLLSRWIGYEYAVFGLLVGSILLLILSTRAVLKVFKNLDYYLYAAS
ncbi:MAG: hypothetical protein Q8934_10330 [Bacillota bacterium]|nr:hypothetical protein [Bacillota bacterium]